MPGSLEAAFSGFGNLLGRPALRSSVTGPLEEQRSSPQTVTGQIPEQEAG